MKTFSNILRALAFFTLLILLWLMWHNAPILHNAPRSERVEMDSGFENALENQDLPQVRPTQPPIEA